jgi:hypothetical protein
MDINDAIISALRNRCALFTGSGFSLGAININNTELYSGRELTKELAKHAGITWDVNLEEAAEEYLRVKGEHELIDIITHLYTVKSICGYHRTVASVPWKRVYTTNYDNVFEKACAEVGKPCLSVAPSDRPKRLPEKSLYCVHLNGSVLNLNSSTLFSEFRLTDSSYLASSLESSPWLYSLKNDLQYSDAFIFIGYSLYDIDIKRLIYQTDDIIDKCFFIVDKHVSEPLRARIERFGVVCPIGIDDFAALVHEQQSSFEHNNYPTFSPCALVETTAPREKVKITDKMVLDLFLRGDYISSIIADINATEKPYYLYRREIQHVIDMLDNDIKNIFVISELGNGKTLFLEGLKYRAIQNGYRVFTLPEYSDDVSGELIQLQTLNTKIVVVVENYQNHKHEIRKLRDRPDTSTILVMSARKSIHDTIIDDIIECIDDNSMAEVEIDKLTENDILWVIETFNTYGLWGQYSNNSIEWKRKYIINSCESEFHGILLKLLDSPHIVSRLKEHYSEIGKLHDRDCLIVSAMIMNVIGHPPSISMLCDIWGTNTINRTSMRRDKLLKEHFDFGHSKVLVRSSVTSEYVLQRLIEISLIVEIIIYMSKRIDTLAYGTYYYSRIIGSIMRIKFLQQVLPEKGRIPAIFEIYETLKTLKYCSKHPLFWLQYAIACLICEDLERAGKYFATAYAYASPDRFDTFQIDNHYSRYLLMKAKRRKDGITEAMKDFMHAHNILREQMYREKIRYPYRVARLYRDVAMELRKELDNDQRDVVVDAANQVLDAISKLPESRTRDKDVRICTRAMEDIKEMFK